MKKIVEDVCREDLRDKILKTFEGIFICKRDKIKLSEIFKKYRDIVCVDVDEEDKYRYQKFYVRFENEPGHSWYNCELHKKAPERYTDIDIKFVLHTNRDGTGWISTVYLDGHDIKEMFKFSYMNDVEIMLIQAVYNKIPIIIDIEDEYDIDNSYDVDY